MKGNMKQIKVYSSNSCNPCKQLKAVLSTSTISSNIEFILLDDTPEVAKQLGIRTVPTTIIYEGETEVQRISGNNPLQIIQAAES